MSEVGGVNVKSPAAGVFFIVSEISIVPVPVFASSVPGVIVLVAVSACTVLTNGIPGRNPFIISTSERKTESMDLTILLFVMELPPVYRITA